MTRRRTQAQPDDERSRGAAGVSRSTRRRGSDPTLDLKLKELFDPVLEEQIPDSLLQILERSRRPNPG